MGQFKYVFEFNEKNVDGRGNWKDLLGGKGAGLAEMSRAGLPVPPGFTISTEACSLYQNDRAAYNSLVIEEVGKAMHNLEKVAGKRFGADNQALLISVRSGAKFSMPGMMDTVLNIGLNDRTVRSLAEETRDPRFAYDSYRRLLQMFGDVVLEVPERQFEQVLDRHREARAVAHEIELQAEDLEAIGSEFQTIIAQHRKEFPQDPNEQLMLAIEAVFQSWQNPRAVTYRKLNHIPDDLGTGVNVQMMVFGNRGKRSGSGVGFTRNPATGEAELYGEYLPQAQGEEVVAGTRTPLPFSDLAERFPAVYEQLLEFSDKLEVLYREMQDFEFTIENGKLYMLQTRDGKRTGLAAVRIALEMVKEGLITSREALLRVSPTQLEQLLHPVFKEDPNAKLLAHGLPASPGAAVGKLVFSADDAVQWRDRGEDVILLRSETTPDDIHGMEAAQGILTARGGMTSHAAVVARGMGKCGLVGCGVLKVEEELKQVRVADLTLFEGDVVSVDGSAGLLYLGALEKIEVKAGDDLLDEFLTLVDKVDAMGVRANADNPREARKSLDFGAIGIGLCRTEHMFFGEDRVPVLQELVLAKTTSQRETALSHLKEFQRRDFRQILKVMDGLPVTVRLLDPPLHEFLPRAEEMTSEIEKLKAKGAPVSELEVKENLLKRIRELQETNPMLGHRGCRLGITYPEITRMQVEALFEAACSLKRAGFSPFIEVMIPLVSILEEFTHQASLVRETAEKVIKDQGAEVSYQVGTMIELPRAALVAGQLAQESEFFSFGTNDLTQTSFGFSRDDAGYFIRIYEDLKILRRDPFQSIDPEGVGELIALATERGRQVRPDLKLGICGEHGGDADSVRFCDGLGLDYVSCSPFRVPGARLAAAQARILSQDVSKLQAKSYA